METLLWAWCCGEYLALICLIPVYKVVIQAGVYGRGYLQQSCKESNSNAKDTKPDISESYIFEYFRREFPNQDLMKIPGSVPPWLLKDYLR
ncbi:cytosolic carboxypeptidase 3-like [Choloepus didactylus]|uniref:cytosolic carboxypeptidase 3-like n=1 Tax=Choloepus didactylus TaxID=27675 RepID=UPI0018A0A099|nr:cytosolic carboxypeptidase 3-like [Choloepus didactylus]